VKSIIIYYSLTGNTHKLAESLASRLKEKGEVSLLRLIPLDESKTFLGQCWRAFLGLKASISELQTDLSNYDFICLGTPVWAFGPTPAVNKYLEICSGLEGKKIILFITYGSGTGINRCFKKMEEKLHKKGVTIIQRLGIQQFNVNNLAFVNKEIGKIV
jgi:flavodoxin